MHPERASNHHLHPRLVATLVWVLALAANPKTSLADTAYGSLNNFDVVNDTSNRCYGFEIELDDCRSRDLSYTYDWNHYGAPRLVEDLSDPLHPKVFVRYESKKNPDGTYASYTNPQDPLHPLGPTDGHAFTDPSVNLGGEHFGVGFMVNPSMVKYHWLVDDPLNPGTLARGPAVTIATPSFTYIPPPAPAMPAQLQVVIAPPPPEVPEIENVEQFGTPVWVKVMKTVQPSGRKIELDELVGDPIDPDAANWAGGEAPETEIEWMVFQKRPPSNPGNDEIEAADELPEGDETVTRRYEFYEYLGPVNPDDGEAQCDNPDNCPDSVGQYIGSQMAGFNVGEPLGMVDHLQDGVRDVPFVERTVAIGGNTPYASTVCAGALPDGLTLDSATALLYGTPTVGGPFAFTICVTDADNMAVSNTYAITIAIPLAVTTTTLPDGAELAAYPATTLAAEGGAPPYSWWADWLPVNLLLSDGGTVSGTPALGTAGSYGIHVWVTDSQQHLAASTLPLRIRAAPPVRGDIDGDRDVDRADLALVVAARNTVAPPGDSRDLDRDGRITLLDARILTTLFTRPGGALQ